MVDIGYTRCYDITVYDSIVSVIALQDRGCVFQKYIPGCGRHRGWEWKGEDAERRECLRFESWAYGEEPYDCHLEIDGVLSKWIFDYLRRRFFCRRFLFLA